MNQHGEYTWFPSGDAVFPAMLEAIGAARSRLRMEFYIYKDTDLGRQFLDRLTAAAQRGVMVQVLIDALGSQELPDTFWQPLRRAGGHCRRFNPLELRRLPIRNHRKLLVCDESIAFVGGFNVAPEYQGDGINRGWLDTGLSVRGDVVAALAVSFDGMYARADERPKWLAMLRKPEPLPLLPTQRNCELLLGTPGRTRNAIHASIFRSLAHARRVRIIVPYFLPGARLRKAIQSVVRRGGRVQIVLPGKTDVAISRLAARSQYQRLLRAGVEIHEYQPQILHAKVFIIDDAIYVGSSNLDPRSLHLNYELMVRIVDPDLRRDATEFFSTALRHSIEIQARTWRQSRSLWTRLHERWARFILARLDPWLARWLTRE